MLGKDYAGQDCGLAAALEVIGERWTLLIVRDAFFGVQRFSDFVARLDIPRSVLAERLGTLVEQGILRRREDPERPGRQIYELTATGEELWPAVHALMGWGSKHRHRSTMTYRHAACGSELVVGGHCPTCGCTPPAGDVLRVMRGGRHGRTDPITRRLRQERRLLEPLTATDGAERPHPAAH
jgi:DNA-binding HxlR family transcriptional regulator